MIDMKNDSLLAEIGTILILKVVLLYFIWRICFAEPLKVEPSNFSQTVFGQGETP